MTSTPAINVGPSNAEKLALLNEFRASLGMSTFAAPWRPARHQPMLDGFLAKAREQLDASNAAFAVQQDAEIERDLADEPSPSKIAADMTDVEIANEDEANGVEPTKLPGYKVLARESAGTKSKIEKPVDFVHAFLDANPDMKRKEAVAALIAKGVNYSTARTQYQRWFSNKR